MCKWDFGFISVVYESFVKRRSRNFLLQYNVLQQKDRININILILYNIIMDVKAVLNYVLNI